VTVKRAALLLLVAYGLMTASYLHWDLRALLWPDWPPLGRLGFPGFSQLIGLVMSLSWAVYFAFIYRSRSQRQNPVSLWAVTLWTAAITVAAAVSSAVQFLTTTRSEAFATGHATWARSALWSLGLNYATMVLWIALIILLAHDPRAQRTRWIAVALAAVALLSTCLEAYRLVQNEARVWERVFARSWRIYPLTALFLLVLAPAIGVFRNVCSVLFPFAVWKEIGPRVPHADAATE
jgi:hypothetical protein